ncbi:hypothetical protein Tco_1549352 [Tanacetum coccineum]
MLPFRCVVLIFGGVTDGLPPDVYSLVNHHRVAKDIWDRVKLLMQGTSLAKQEREFQKNTKFLNYLSSEWSKLITDVKLARDLHTTNYDQLHAYLQQHEIHANEIRITRERYQDPLTLVANQHPSSYPYHQAPYNTPAPMTNPQYSQQFSQTAHQLYSHAPMTNPYDANYHLQTSSNPINQATIQDGRFTVQQVQGRQVQNNACNGAQGNAAGMVRNNAGHGKNDAFQFEDLDAYDLDCKDISSTKAVLMANLSSCNSDVVSEVPYTKHYQPKLINDHVQEMQYSEQPYIDEIADNEITSDSNIILYFQYLLES